MSRNAFGLGQADVMCEDGRKGRVFYTYQDEYTGTAVGQGAMHSGAKKKNLVRHKCTGIFARGHRRTDCLPSL